MRAEYRSAITCPLIPGAALSFVGSLPKKLCSGNGVRHNKVLAEMTNGWKSTVGRVDGFNQYTVINDKKNHKPLKYG
ncbi:hypothetical protein [Chryseobacterium koreense]